MTKLFNKDNQHIWHWSSTEYSSTGAWNQYFASGYQYDYYKTNSFWARAVRKVKK